MAIGYLSIDRNEENCARIKRNELGGFYANRWPDAKSDFRGEARGDLKGERRREKG
jgi:hypothetical protein